MSSTSTGHRRPLAIVTCGPAHEPLDSVRRITNFATGEIGAILSEALLDAGWDVICFRGEGATAPFPERIDVRPFSTNASLADAIRSLDQVPGAIFHAAALCDFQVAAIDGACGQAKISSRSAELLVRLRPALKLLPFFREWFPQARIIGWKYELDGTQTEAVSKAGAQIKDAKTDACVVNGAAYGHGFGLVTESELIDLPDKTQLAATLVRRFAV